MFSTLWKPCIRFFIGFTLICGIVYTGSVTILSQLIFPDQANGSLVEKDGVVVGSTLIGQPFTEDDHLWGRPSRLDTKTFVDEDGTILLYAYGANNAVNDPSYQKDEESRRAELAKALDLTKEQVPDELVTYSASGLDPEISVEAAKAQAKRIADAKGISVPEVNRIIDSCTKGKGFNLFGQERVNVLEVNLKLDNIK
ncbi:K+-transporting ATPase, C subunit [Firmicutes bacterium M10-2]|nr:K+-transporting ATPase, C subunit [Firmicutes bacterium M10-2]